MVILLGEAINVSLSMISEYTYRLWFIHYFKLCTYQHFLNRSAMISSMSCFSFFITVRSLLSYFWLFEFWIDCNVNSCTRTLNFLKEQDSALNFEHDGYLYLQIIDVCIILSQHDISWRLQRVSVFYLLLQHVPVSLNTSYSFLILFLFCDDPKKCVIAHFIWTEDKSHRAIVDCRL